MKIQLTAKHLSVTPAISSYVNSKMEKAQKYFDHIVWGQAILSVEKRAHNVEFLIHAPKQTFRALATAADLYSAVDLASDKIDKQLKKFKDKLKNRHKNGSAIDEESIPVIPALSAGLSDGIKTTVIRQSVAPMTPAQAIDEMERLDQSFRLFQDKESGQIRVLYRGTDQSYKIIQPVKKAGL
jgi:putative sigma-54 modulation protein